MATFQTVIDQVLATFSDIPLGGTGLNITKLLNDADEEIQSVISLRKNQIYVGFVSGQLLYDADSTIIRVFNSDRLYGDGTRQPMTARGTTEMNHRFPGWRGVQGTPDIVGLTQNTTTGQYFFYPKPNFSTLVVSSITNASPPLVTTTTAHGLTDGSRVDIENATGTTLTGSYYVSVGIQWGVSPTTQFVLFSDSSLTLPIAASGVGTAGLVATQQYPMAALDCTQTTPLTSASNMQNLPQIRRLYANAMRFLWAQDHRPEQVGVWQAAYEKDLQICQEMVERREEDVQFEIRSFSQDPNFRTSGSTRCGSDF